ncbi:MAG: hypothetical protein JST82_04890 [Bacteroidetes bacterium]|nr:hypothetical protein [Bacteroidota bacterium]
MKNYRYTLEPYKGQASRYTCPQCGLKRVFVRYIDTETNQHLGDDIGRCNRQDSCGYHKPPREAGTTLPSLATLVPPSLRTGKVSHKNAPPVSSIEKHFFLETLSGYENNHLAHYLRMRFGNEVTNRLINQYYIGTHHHWDCSTVFWQIDIHGIIRTGKVMLYYPDSGQRIKTPINYITWMHKLCGYEHYTTSGNACLENTCCVATTNP